MSKLKTVFKLAIYSILLIGCSSPGPSPAKEEISVKEAVSNDTTRMMVINGDILFSQSEAEKILGEPSKLTERDLTTKYGNSVYKSSYTTDKTKSKSGVTGNVYFMIEQYDDSLACVETYKAIKTANENNGIKVLDDIGDEAYFHSDNQNFYFILVRKGTKMFRIKVNKISTNTSLNQFKSIAKEISVKI